MIAEIAPVVTRSTLEKRLLAVILSGYVILAVIYSVVTPLFEASDELWHYPMVQYIATTGQLPVQDPANVGPWRQEGSQPPLYYLLAAALTAGIDTSDMGIIRRQNPHADIGVVLPDGNINMITHRTAAEAFPWHGTVLAVHIARLLSVALGLSTVYVTYQLGHELFPYEPVIRLGAAAFVAFLPMFLFISGSVNNDNLSNLLGNLLLLRIVRLLNPQRSPGWRDYVVIGLVTGAGLLAKYNIGFLIPLVALALLVVSLRQKNWRPLVFGGIISGTLTIAIAGWWYLRNQQLYGDPTGLNVFLEVVGRRLVPANLAQLWSERSSFTQAFWGFFGGVNVPMPAVVYALLSAIGVIGLIGALAFWVVWLIRRRSRLIVHGWLPMLFSAGWPVLTFISYLRWTAETPASQGRLIFGALSPISIWLVVGLVWWLPRRARPGLMAVIIIGLALIAVFTPFAVIAPAYAEQSVSESAQDAPLAQYAAVNSGGQLSLLSAVIAPDSTQVQPEGYVHLETVWQIDQPFDRDWSLFVHLVTPDGVILSQRDVYPAQGLLATSDLPTGRRWRNETAVWIPPAAYAPMTLDVRIGWYHLPSGERLQRHDGSDTFSIGQVKLIPRASSLEVPNPISVNFGDEIELVGYELSDLSPAAGDAVQIILYWRGMKAMSTDYKVFASIIDPRTLTKYAASDTMPADWTAPTSTWVPGQIIADGHELQVSPNTPPGIYELQIGWYQEVAGEFRRLRIHTPDGGQANDLMVLSRVRVLPPEKEFSE
ncbi:MAG: glycosyltransferase family 39 protein [Anaerolineae bacterium]|nr:glycosyltransferase family 39 protein [Anaerolineae bacterium]